MAKELPYFKFEPGEYESGNISICSMAAQGVWNRVCNIYWLRLGDVTLKHLQRKLGYEDLIQELIDEGCIKLNGDHVVINFLDLQMAEFQDKSKKGSNAAKVRWAKERKRAAMVNKNDSNADAMQTHNERNTNRGEYSRIEENRGDENRVEDTPPKSPKGESANEGLSGFEKFKESYPIDCDYSKFLNEWMAVSSEIVPIILHDIKKRYPRGTLKKYVPAPHNYLKNKVWEEEIIERSNGNSQQKTGNSSGYDPATLSNAATNYLRRKQNSKNQ